MCMGERIIAWYPAFKLVKNKSKKGRIVLRVCESACLCEAGAESGQCCANMHILHVEWSLSDSSEDCGHFVGFKVQPRIQTDRNEDWGVSMCCFRAFDEQMSTALGTMQDAVMANLSRKLYPAIYVHATSVFYWNDNAPSRVINISGARVDSRVEQTERVSYRVVCADICKR